MLQCRVLPGRPKPATSLPVEVSTPEVSSKRVGCWVHDPFVHTCPAHEGESCQTVGGNGARVPAGPPGVGLCPVGQPAGRGAGGRGGPAAGLPAAGCFTHSGRL